VTGSLYVYGIVGATEAVPLGAGIDGTPLRSVAAGEVAAIVHDHRGKPYGGTEEEVRRYAVAHAQVVDRLWQATSAILPMSFDVLVASAPGRTAEQRLAAWLHDSARAMTDRLAVVRGRVELRVDVDLDPAEASQDDEQLRALRGDTAAASPGVARLLRKRIQRREHEVAEARADALYPDLRRRLAGVSADIVENPRGTAEPGEVLVLSASLLVDQDRVPLVGAELRRISEEERAVRLRFFGPWPPYSFADLPGPDADRAG
jgi:hypothetical protein